MKYFLLKGIKSKIDAYVRNVLKYKKLSMIKKEIEKLRQFYLIINVSFVCMNLKHISMIKSIVMKSARSVMQMQ